ncbi:hypothetical protein NDU88_005301 [Pleurodeles waltl]|uniref:Uncharacterized protein n=1 Tax=Pleurodeles waltl TaxID=8319 RepID=A0AAV7V5E3_PLEWA|nr:hypothetical protein NDU88_005301 [Pleurodeles waltl]
MRMAGSHAQLVQRQTGLTLGRRPAADAHGRESCSAGAAADGADTGKAPYSAGAAADGADTGKALSG